MNKRFDDNNFVEKYYEMMKAYDNTFVISQFKKVIPKKSKVLELGFGTGLDYFALKDDYKMTLSDFSNAFIDKFEEINNIRALQLDAVTIGIDEKLSCIYSNKVLYVLTDEEIVTSFQRQAELLEEGGFIFHTFWYDEKAMSTNDTNYVNEDKLKKLLKNSFQVIELITYSEMEEADSLILVAKKLK